MAIRCLMMRPTMSDPSTQTPIEIEGRSLDYHGAPLRNGKVSVFRYAGGTDVVVHQSIVGAAALSLLLAIICALIASTFFLPSGHTQFSWGSVDVPERWPSRAAAIFVVLLIPLMIIGLVQNAVVPTRVECRHDGLNCIRPSILSRRKTLCFEHDQIAGVRVGEDRSGDSIEYYVAVIDPSGKEHRLPLNSLTRKEAIFAGVEMRSAMKLPTPTDEATE